MGAFFTKEDTVQSGDVSASPGELFLSGFQIESEYEELAVFGNATFQLSPKLDFGAGVRLSANDMKYQQRPGLVDL